MEGIEQLKFQVEQWSQQGFECVQQIPPIQLYAAIGILLLSTLILLSLRLFKSTKSNTIVLSGLSGSGKTVLFYKLRDGSSHHGTVTSMESNEGTFVLHAEAAKKDKVKPVHLVDVPGHSRLRPKLDEFLPQATAIVFVVDALDFLPNCRVASECLYDILTNGSVVKKKIPVLILCNKTDKITAHTKELIQKQIEKEMEKLRASRSAVSAADIANDFTLGLTGKAFSFSHCQNEVTVAEASGLTGEISQVEQFIREGLCEGLAASATYFLFFLIFAVIPVYELLHGSQEFKRKCLNLECRSGKWGKTNSKSCRILYRLQIADCLV